MKTNPRRRARELVLQGLYERQQGGAAADQIAADLRESAGHQRADQPYFGELWSGIGRDYDELIARIAPYLDRKATDLSPVERAIIVIGAWELVNRLEIPYRVVINEAVELAKAYGGTDGHKFVNGVLDKVAADARAEEIAALARERGTQV
ncbi:MAG TPA: transcription antitermination factor NusB [Casimicrobiaceae bacterium]|nr:transcription antitermination factor NusB [Casimicrobiaceae bacterium]